MGAPERPTDLKRFPLLQVVDDAMSSQWEAWISAAGVPDLPLDEGPRFPNTNMALQAAVAGQGVALARSAHVDGGLSAAGLTRLFDVVCPATSAYYLVCPDGAQSRPRIAAFLRWIEAEAARSQQRYETEMTSIKVGRSHS